MIRLLRLQISVEENFSCHLPIPDVQKVCGMCDGAWIYFAEARKDDMPGFVRWRHGLSILMQATVAGR